MTKDDRPRCAGCHRLLTALASITRGRGRICQARFDARVRDVTAAAVGIIPAPALAKATQAIEDGAIVHRTRELYFAASSNGAHAYEVDARAQSCTCLAGRHGRRCYHVYAAAILAAAAAAERHVVQLRHNHDPAIVAAA